MTFARFAALIALLCSTAALASGSAVPPEELSREIGARIERVPEFRFIEKEAERLGVRAWLFGGTAAGFAHYVKWDHLRENGDHRFQADRFDYDYSNIYRSNQDLDIVIDGDPAKAKELQESLQKAYPHFQGSKTQWEVRLLTQDMGDKQALLNNPDFLNQHTDSNSTGMIEITPPKSHEPRVRDLRDWASKDPFFLRDVSEGTLHYYYSPLHESTRFAREGRNPPILSAIRYLTKAFQYELTIKPGDLARIHEVVSQFDPKSVAPKSYVSTWIEKNGKKLIENAVNIEYAVNVLDQLGLRQKLASMGDRTNVESLAWWMNKEPLRSEPVGKGTGKTAREIFLEKGWAKPGEPLVVAHETKSFLAYESITRAHTGDPNVLISRSGAAGENAYQGDGFYTRVGRQGARGTGLTIRFTIDPNAREGTDFKIGSTQDYLVWQNKRALRVIPESLKLGPVEYFEFLAGDRSIDGSDRGMMEKLQRRMEQKAHTLSPEEKREIAEIARKNIKGPSPSGALLAEWFKMGLDREFPDVSGTNLNILCARFYLTGRTPPNELAGVIDPSVRDVLGGYPDITEEQAQKFRQAIAPKSSHDEDLFHYLREALSSPKPSRTAIAAWFYGGFADRDPAFFGVKRFYESVMHDPPSFRMSDRFYERIAKQVAKHTGAAALAERSILEEELDKPNPSWAVIDLWLKSADPELARKLVTDYAAHDFKKPGSILVAAIWSREHGDPFADQFAKAVTPLGYFETLRLPEELRDIFHPSYDPRTELQKKMKEYGEELAAGKIKFPVSKIEAMVEADVAAGLPNFELYKAWLSLPESLSRPDLMEKIYFNIPDPLSRLGDLPKSRTWKPFFQEAVENLLLRGTAPPDFRSPVYAQEFKATFSEPLDRHGPSRPPLTEEQIKTIATHLASTSPSTGSQAYSLVTSPSGPNGLRIMKDFFKRKADFGTINAVAQNFYHPGPEISEVAREIFDLPENEHTRLSKIWAFKAIAKENSPWVGDVLLRYSQSTERSLQEAALEQIQRFPSAKAREAVIAVLKSGGPNAEAALKASVILSPQDFLHWNQYYSQQSGMARVAASRNLEAYPHGPPMSCEAEFERISR